MRRRLATFAKLPRTRVCKSTFRSHCPKMATPTRPSLFCKGSSRQIPVSPKPIRTWLVKALVILGEFNDALPFIQDYLKHHATDGEALTLRGTIYRGLGDYVS